LHRGVLDPRHPDVVSDTSSHVVWATTVVLPSEINILSIQSAGTG